MTLYAIGDVQGCANALDALLDRIAFSRDTDRLWLAGDLVNRGPHSLRVLRTIMSLGDSVVTVLGNHDLHFLATAASVRPLRAQDTLAPILAADDRDMLIDWLRQRPLLHHDVASLRALVHAGIPPGWTLTDAERAAHEIEQMLRAASWRESLEDMYGDAPRQWRPDLSAAHRRRFGINALTRMRFCAPDGSLDFEHTGPPGSQPESLVPWFDHPLRATASVHIVFGHWAALGLLQRQDITATDSGCVWGGALTAVPIDPPGAPIAVRCAPA
jgi:bis(5'-nucleosyl)-tetraphosphatase (symmetrical)